MDIAQIWLRGGGREAGREGEGEGDDTGREVSGG